MPGSFFCHVPALKRRTRVRRTRATLASCRGISSLPQVARVLRTRVPSASEGASPQQLQRSHAPCDGGGAEHDAGIQQAFRIEELL